MEQLQIDTDLRPLYADHDGLDVGNHHFAGYRVVRYSTPIPQIIPQIFYFDFVIRNLVPRYLLVCKEMTLAPNPYRLFLSIAEPWLSATSPIRLYVIFHEVIAG